MNFSREELKLFVNSGKEQIEKVNKAFFIVVLWLIVIICIWTKTFTLFATILFLGLSVVSTVTYVIYLRTKRNIYYYLYAFTVNVSLSLLSFWGAYHFALSGDEQNFVLFILFFLGYLLNIGFWLFFTIHLIKKAKFEQKQKKKPSMIGPIVGSLVGVTSAKYIFRLLDERGVIILMSGLLLLLSFLLSFSYILGVKYYLIKKYGFDEDDEASDEEV